MSFSSNHWPFDGTSFNFLSQQPINPPTPRYLPYPPPHHSSSASAPYPRLPLPNFTQARLHSTAAQPRPQQHSTPSASLHAALREGTDFLPRPSIVPRLPPLSRVNSASNQQSSFGYIPNHFFYSPPQSPLDSDPPHHTTATNSIRQPAASLSVHPFAGPSFTNHSVGPSIANPLAHPQSIDHPTPRFDTEHMAGAFRSEQSQSRYQNPAHPQHVKEESPNTMPASTSTAATSRKRARPSDPGSPPSATKRRLNHPPAPIELDDTDEDVIEELE
ncbi:unnamed protein product [Aureobasidium vineae]|uniref:Uncharacterized protein n=1 Tax=Aureobasidium vineae TaxID=2773715 RepID=A0A9N8J770_9PEZI|nr:unnamed protein product [Aureobasidium vineae]